MIIQSYSHVCTRDTIHTAQYTAQYSKVQNSKVQYSTLTVHNTTVQYIILQYSTLQYSTAQYSIVQYVHTFSPISVISPPGNISRSCSRAQSCSVLLYSVSLMVLPNKMLSFTVAFCIHACWGTYATCPCN